MGPVQTAIGQLLGTAGGAALIGKKLKNENEGQAAEEKRPQTAEDAPARKEAYTKAIQAAQQKKIDTPKQVYFWGDSGEAIGTSNEIAYVLSAQSLHNATSSKRRSRDKVRERKQMLAKRKLQARK